MKSFRKKRDGAIAVLMCVLMLPLLGLLAFSIDYGFLLYLRTDLQRVADQAALAAARDLTPDPQGNQDLTKVRATVRQYVAMNFGENFVVNDSDIEIGRYNPKTIYSSVEILEPALLSTDDILDTVRVRLRRDEMANSSVSLYFARLFGDTQSDVSAYSTAVLQPARFLGPGTAILPIAIEHTAWGQILQGQTASIYGGGQIVGSDGSTLNGNWGTVDIGLTSNSTTSLSDQIANGLQQSDLNALYKQGRIEDASHIDSIVSMDLNGDTGLSAGLKHAILAAHDMKKVAPIYKEVVGSGGKLEFTIVSWVTVEIVDSGWKGAQNSFVMVRKAYTYDKDLYPVHDLTDSSVSIEGAFTSPVLIQ